MLFYTKVFDQPILSRDGAGFYSVRAPDGEVVLMVESRDSAFATSLTKRQGQSISTQSCRHKCLTDCKNWRTCPRFSFLPSIIEEDQGVDRQTYFMQYDCIKFGEMVQAKALAEYAQVGVGLAFRLTASLLLLVDWLVDQNISVDLSLRNLLFDLKTAKATLIDWTGSQVNGFLNPSCVASYYQKLGSVMLTLVGATQSSHDWTYPSEYTKRTEHEFLEFLQSMANWSETLPADYREVNAVLVEQHQLQQNLLDKLLALLPPGGPESEQLLHELVKDRGN